MQSPNYGTYRKKLQVKNVGNNKVNNNVHDLENLKVNRNRDKKIKVKF